MLISRDIYLVKPTNDPITGVRFRGRVRKYTISQGQNLLIENAENGKDVYFAIPTTDDPSAIIAYINDIVGGVSIEKVGEKIINPVLSKFKINDESRYIV